MASNRQLQINLQKLAAIGKTVDQRSEFRRIGAAGRAALANGSPAQRAHLRNLRASNKRNIDYSEARRLERAIITTAPKGRITSGKKSAISRTAREVYDQFQKGTRIVSARNPKFKTALREVTGQGKQWKVFFPEVRQNETIGFQIGKDGKPHVVLKSKAIIRSFIPINSAAFIADSDSELSRMIGEMPHNIDGVNIGVGKWVWGQGNPEGGNKVSVEAVQVIIDEWKVKYSKGAGHHSELDEFFTGMYSVKLRNQK